MVSVACAFEPKAVAPSLVAWAHRPEPVASTPLTLVQVAAFTLLMTEPLVPRVCTVPSLLAPPMVVAPMVAPLAAAAVAPSTNGFSDVDNEAVPVAMPCKPDDSDVTWLKPVDKDESPVDKEAIPVDAEVDNDVALLLVVDSPVDSEARFEVLIERPVDNELMLLVLLDKPLEVEVDSEFTLLFVVLKPVEVEVDNDAMLDKAEVDNDVNCPTFTASVAAVPAARFVIF